MNIHGARKRNRRTNTVVKNCERFPINLRTLQNVDSVTLREHKKHVFKAGIWHAKDSRRFSHRRKRWTSTSKNEKSKQKFNTPRKRLTIMTTIFCKLIAISGPLQGGYYFHSLSQRTLVHNVTRLIARAHLGSARDSAFWGLLARLALN